VGGIDGEPLGSCPGGLFVERDGSF